MIRVCVLVSSYEGSDSEMKEYEGTIFQNPHNYFGPDTEDKYKFTLVEIKKATSYRQIRQLVKSGNFDVFYNQCDGAKDEDRAGIDVVEALEEFRVPFTGANSKSYEPTKPEMKMIAYLNGIKTANHVVLSVGQDVATLCDGLNFPVIVKHISGYSSVGMDKSCKVFNMEQLVERVKAFVELYDLALVEEFISGDEATILACSDVTQPDGIRVFPPAQVSFPPGEDFKHFYLKWATFEGMEWRLVQKDDPALPQMIDMARKSFKTMMGGVGYGRIDVRIDRSKNEVYFLEINPNCGIMYPEGQEGSADWILRLSPSFKQRDFAELQIRESLRQHRENLIRYATHFDIKSGYCLKAVTAIEKDAIIFKEEGNPRVLFSLQNARKTLSEQECRLLMQGCRPLDTKGNYYMSWNAGLLPKDLRCFNHSCSPNMGCDRNGTLNVIALRDIAVGEELTMDYRDFMDVNMEPFECKCGSSNCVGTVAPKIMNGNV